MASSNHTSSSMAALPPHGDMLQRLNHFRNFDQLRQAEIEFYINKCHELDNLCATLRSDLEDEQNTKRTYKKRVEQAETAAARKFAVVLVDGDGYYFQKAFFDAVAAGGSNAANQLYQEIVKNLSEVDGINPDCDVLVNIYANKYGLAKALAYAGHISHPQQLDQFFQSFTQSRSLFQFIDCGSGKERVDAKLRDTFRFYAHNVQCQQIFLACSHDTGYIAEFSKYSHDPVANKIVLVHGWQTPITAKEYNTKLPFRSTRFDLVFEATALEVLPKTEVAYVSYGAEDLSHTSSSDNTGLELSPVITRSSSSTNSFALNPSAEMFPTPTEAAQVVPSSRGRTGAVKGPSVKGGVPVNRRGQRIDLPMRIPTAAEIDKFDERIATQKLCNEHHLRDNCVTYRCKYDHQPIDAVMLNTLRYKARSIPCAQKSKCRRLDCFYGHQCPWGSKACDNPKCNFIKADMHDVDETLDRRVSPESGY